MNICPVFGLAMVTTCLGCYSNWFLKRVDGYLWRWTTIIIINVTNHFFATKAIIITFLRCCFWSPIILLVCVARQVNLWRNRSETYFVPKVTQSFLPRVARPTPSVAKLSSTETNGTRAAKTDGRRSKTKWFAFVNSGLSNESQQQWTVSIGYVMESERSCPSPHFVAVFFSKMKIEALKPSICDNIVFLDLFYLKYSLFLSQRRMSSNTCMQLLNASCLYISSHSLKRYFCLFVCCLR